MRSLLVGCIAAILFTSCSLPQDQHGTLRDVRGHALRVGVTEAPPFIVKRDGTQEPAGVEVDLVRDVADRLGATVVWHWGTTDHHMEALARWELDLVAGGLTTATPWKRHVALTRPYYTTYDAIGAPPGASVGIGRVIAVPEGAPVAVPEASVLVAVVEREGFRPVPMARPEVFDGLVATPEWQLRAWGRAPLQRLRPVRHVVAVPPGESGFLVAIERELAGRAEAIENALQEAAR